MRTSTITPSFISAFLAAPTLATINYDKAYYNDGHVDNGIWIDGESARSYVYMGPDSQNPCNFNGGWFTAQNGFRSQLVGCGGGDFRLLSSDGSLNNYARRNPYKNACSGAYNANGRYIVDQQWSF